MLQEGKVAVDKANFRPLARLLNEAIRSSPIVDSELLYRGISIPTHQLGAYKTGEILLWGGFSSCTTDFAVANDFGSCATSSSWLTFVYVADSQAKDTTNVVFCIDTQDLPHVAIPLTDVSAFAAESEVLLRPFSVLEVVSTEVMSGGKMFVSVKLVDTSKANVLVVDPKPEEVLGAAPPRNTFFCRCC